MTEWGVIGVLVTITGLGVALVTPIVKLNGIITKLSAIVERMALDLGDLTTRNAATHERIFLQLGDHEHRITVLETKEEHI